MSRLMSIATIFFFGFLANCSENGVAADAGQDVTDGEDGWADLQDCLLPPPPETVDCQQPQNCPPISIAGEAPFSSINFSGFADPSLAHDPENTQRIWLAYSWPHIVPGRALDGSRVQMAAVSSHLARSDDGGRSFTFVKELYAAIPTADPEGSGENGLLSSETVSLAWRQEGAQTTWYAAHLRYFLRPQTGYVPRWGTSWTVRIGAASSPDKLSEAEEVVIGVSTTASVYHPAVRLDQLAGLPIQDCALLNNPTLFVRGDNLYLIVECLAFDGPEPDFQSSSTQVFATAGDAIHLVMAPCRQTLGSLPGR